MWAPAAAELVFRTTLPRALQLHYLIFITLGPYAGSALNVYVAIADWDTLIHFDSGVMLAWLGMLWVAAHRGARRASRLPAWFALLVIQLTAMAFAAAWEICEFASDQLIGTVVAGRSRRHHGRHHGGHDGRPLRDRAAADPRATLARSRPPRSCAAARPPSPPPTSSVRRHPDG